MSILDEKSDTPLIQNASLSFKDNFYNLPETKIIKSNLVSADLCNKILDFKMSRHNVQRYYSSWYTRKCPIGAIIIWFAWTNVLQWCWKNVDVRKSIAVMKWKGLLKRWLLHLPRLSNIKGCCKIVVAIFNDLLWPEQKAFHD